MKPLPLQIDAKRFWQFFKFCFVGGSGVIVDMAVLHVLSHPKWMGWNVSLAKVCAAEIAMLNNFAWNELWTFRQKQETRTWRVVLKRLLTFNLICGIGILWAVLLLNLFYRVAGWNLYLSNLLAIVIVTLWNFWLNARFNWKVIANGKEKQKQGDSLVIEPNRPARIR